MSLMLFENFQNTHVEKCNTLMPSKEKTLSDIIKTIKTEVIVNV